MSGTLVQILTPSEFTAIVFSALLLLRIFTIYVLTVTTALRYVLNISRTFALLVRHATAADRLVWLLKKPIASKISAQCSGTGVDTHEQSIGSGFSGRHIAIDKLCATGSLENPQKNGGPP